MDNTESQESKTNDEIESRKAQVKADLANHVPWQNIAKKYHISPKTISKINKGESLSSSSSQSAMSASSEWASIAFQAFESGKGPIQTVIDTKIPPDEILKLHSQWMQMKKIELSIPNLPTVLDLNMRLEKIANDMTRTDVLVAMYYGGVFGTTFPYCPKCNTEFQSDALSCYCKECGYQCDLGFRFIPEKKFEDA
jgi:hypothetical protein